MRLETLPTFSQSDKSTKIQKKWTKKRVLDCDVRALLHSCNVFTSPSRLPSPKMQQRMGVEKNVIAASNPKKQAAINGKNKEEKDVENNDKCQKILV